MKEVIIDGVVYVPKKDPDECLCPQCNDDLCCAGKCEEVKPEEPKFYIGEWVECEKGSQDWQIGYYHGYEKGEGFYVAPDLFGAVSNRGCNVRKISYVSLKDQYLTLINLLPKEIKEVLKHMNYIATDMDGKVEIYSQLPKCSSSCKLWGLSIEIGSHMRIGYIDLELAKVDWKDSCMKLSDVVVYE